MEGPDRKGMWANQVREHWRTQHQAGEECGQQPLVNPTVMVATTDGVKIPMGGILTHTEPLIHGHLPLF